MPSLGSWRVSIRIKLIAFVTVVTVVAGVVLVLSFTSLFNSSFKRELYNESRAFSSLATEPLGETYLLFRDSGKIRIVERADELLALQPNISNVRIVDIDGSERYVHDDTVASDDYKFSDITKLKPTYVEDSNGTLLYVVQPFVEANSIHRITMVYSIDSSRVEDEISAATQKIAGASLIVLVLIVALLNGILEWTFIRPTKRLIENALLIGRGENSYKLGARRNDEIGALDIALENMAARFQQDIHKLKALDEAKSEFMVIVTHNLHTPLAIIRDYLELVQTYDIDEKTRDGTEVIKTNVRRLQALIEDTIIIASVEADENPMQFRPVDLNKFFESITKEAQQMAQSKGLNFISHADNFDKEIYVSSVYLRSAIWNLLENALKFTKQGEISLRFSEIGGQLKIDVTDTGVGISHEQQQKLFTKFHRGTDLYRYEFDGLGLGLYTTKLIVDGHSGDISISSIPEEGTTATISIPYISDKSKLSMRVRARLDPFSEPRTYKAEEKK